MKLVILKCVNSFVAPGVVAPEFPPGAGQTCWTKTLHKTDKALAIRFQFYNGDYKWHQMGLRSHGVRAVRAIKK